MAVVLVTSATGAPGVTTCALGLALTWPSDVLLIDCDRDPSQAVQAGFLRGSSPGAPGLMAIAKAHREGRPLAAEINDQAVSLTDSSGPTRRFLPGFTHPGAPGLFTMWQDFADSIVALSSTGTDVIIDAGRIGRDGLASDLISAADVVMLVVQSSLRSLAGARLHLPQLHAHIDSCPGHAELGIGVVAENKPYSSSEISQQFGLPVWLSLPADEPSASVLIDGAPEPRRFFETSLMRGFKVAASRLRDRIAERNAERHHPRRAAQ